MFMRNSSYILTLWGIFLCISTSAQKGRIFIAAKPLSDGRFVSRIITLDSAETQRLNGSSIIYQRFENKKLVFEKTLRPESGEILRSLAMQKNNFYLDEMTEIYFNEEGYPLDSSYHFLYFLSLFNFDGAKWMGTGTEDRAIPGRNSFIRYTIIDRKGRKKQLPDKVLDAAFWNYKAPKPGPPKVRCGNLTTTLELDARSTKGAYWGFLAQRNEVGKDRWEWIDEKILINAFHESDSEELRAYYKMVDSLPRNEQLYGFRWVGVDYFGDAGPPGDSVVCAGYEDIGSGAEYRRYEIVQDSFANIYWKIDSSVLPKVRSIDLALATDSLNGNYRIIRTDILDGVNPVYVKLPDPIGYYRFVTQPYYGEAIVSIAIPIERLDHIPPAIPQGLTGKIDSLGRVELSWKANTEKDLWGYRIYYANNKSDEFSLLNAEPRMENYYRDTVDINNLSRKIYYKILALDRRGNYSGFSEIVEIAKPDTIPPAAPLIKGVIQYKNKSIALVRMAGSPSEDVYSHRLLRTGGLDSMYQVFLTFGSLPADTIIVDTLVEYGKKYHYILSAEDYSHHTAYSETFSVTPIADGIRKGYPVENAILDTVRRQVIINWKRPLRSKEKFILYKSTQGSPFTRAATIDLIDGQYVDRNIPPDFRVQYKIRTLYEDGTYSNMKEIEVKIKKR